MIKALGVDDMDNLPELKEEISLDSVPELPQIFDSGASAEKIKAKVDELKTDNEQVKESYYRVYENRIKTSRKERPKNLLESVIISLSENAHRNEVLKEAFINEGKTNLDKIMNVATGIYVTLEAMNSSRLQVMDKRVFNEVLTSLSKK